MAISPVAMHGTALELAMPPRLGPRACRSLLGDANDGYLALSRGALPVVLPVSCSLDGESLLVRAGPGSLERVTPQPGVVAFATTIPSGDGTTRSEVLVQGRAEVVGDTPADVPPPLPLVNTGLTTVFRVTLEIVTGWQYGPAGPGPGVRFASDLA